MARIRLDQALVARGLVESREKAQRLIMAGQVRVDGHMRDKASLAVTDEAVVTVDQPERFVSRGGEKLEAAFQHFGFDVAGVVCVDVGASTGGFTDCLLQHGAAKVYALDVGKDQLHWKIRQDPRVVAMDGINARLLKPDALPEKPSFAVVDVSFISLNLVLPAVIPLLTERAQLVTLIKPQFEAGRDKIGAGGVVRDESVRLEVVEKIRLTGCGKLGLTWHGVHTSPIIGPAGNVEFLAYWSKT